MPKKLPERIGYSRRNEITGYACAKPGCRSEHDAFYIREDLATCTPEERAVIEAAIAYHHARQVHLAANDATTEDSAAISAAALETDFEDAVEALIATKA